jgi:hypothetical protein
MADEKTTQPMLEAILARVNALAEQVTAFQSKMESDMVELREDMKSFQNRMEKEFTEFRESVEERLDDIDKQTTRTRMDMLNVRNEFREIRNQLKEKLSA